MGVARTAGQISVHKFAGCWRTQRGEHDILLSAKETDDTQCRLVDDIVGKLVSSPL